MEEKIGRGVGIRDKDNEDFKEFIEDMKVIDMPVVRSKFTWYGGSGNAMSRIGRFLLSVKLVSDWEVNGQLVGRNELSDNCLVWLKSGGCD